METIFVLDDDKLAADSLVWLLQSVGYRVFAFYDPQHFLESALKDAELFLVDIRMPKMDGLEVLELLRMRGVTSPVVMISGHGDIQTAVMAMKKGADNFIEKPYRENVLLATVRQCLKDSTKGGRPESTLQKIDPDMRAQLEKLSERQLQILRLVGQGQSSKEIAKNLGITPHTVDNHRSLIKTRLGVQSLTEIVRIACLLEG